MNVRLAGLVLCWLVALPLVAVADGYTYRDGYYWSNGRPFVRQAYTYRGSDGCYYTRYRYEPAATRSAEASYDASQARDWRTAIADILRTKVEYEEFAKSLELLGGRTASRSFDAGRLIGGDPYSGQTAYGYSYRSVTDVFGDVDRQALLERFARSTENAQSLASEAHKSLGQLIDREGDKSERIAEIVARGQTTAEALRAAAELLRSSEPQTRTRVETRTDVTVPESTTNDAQGFPLLQKYCVACHTGNAAKRGVVLDGSKRLTPELAQRASLAVYQGKGLASPAAAKLVRAPMPPKSSDPIADHDLPGVLAELGRLTR